MINVFVFIIQGVFSLNKKISFDENDFIYSVKMKICFH